MGCRIQNIAQAQRLLVPISCILFSVFYILQPFFSFDVGRWMFDVRRSSIKKRDVHLFCILISVFCFLKKEP